MLIRWWELPVAVNCGGPGGTPGPCDIKPDDMPTTAVAPAKKPKAPKAPKPKKPSNSEKDDAWVKGGTGDWGKDTEAFDSKYGKGEHQKAATRYLKKQEKQEKEREKARVAAGGAPRKLVGAKR